MNDARSGSTATRQALLDAWPSLEPEERLRAFRSLGREDAQELFLELSTADEAALLQKLPAGERRLWIRLLPPDEAADVILASPEDLRERLLGLLDVTSRKEVSALLAYAEDAAGGLMSPRFARVRPDATVDETIRYLKQQARFHVETIYYGYVLDAEQRLLGVVSLRQLIVQPGDARIDSIMKRDLVTVREDVDQEEVAKVFKRAGLLAIPVVDPDGRVKGIITAEDIAEVVEEEATEDIQKIGGSEPLEAPYLTAPFATMFKKRAGWLTALFLGEMLTTTAMTRYAGEIESAVVLAFFVPLIIASGGNSGSQAATLVIRALALGEVRLRDWWRVVRRELASGLALGAIVGAIGIARVLLWELLFHSYGEQHLTLALTVGVTLVGVVTWGTLTGALLPFLLRRAGFDPASASTPLVSTLVDVTGLVIYFTTAGALLHGTLL